VIAPACGAGIERYFSLLFSARFVLFDEVKSVTIGREEKFFYATSGTHVFLQWLIVNFDCSMPDALFAV